MIVRAAISFLVALPLLAASAEAQSRYPYPVGEMHPDFRLPNIDGETPASLSDYQGKKVLLVHFASW